MQTDLFKTLNTISTFNCYTSWIHQNIRPYLSGNVLDIGSGIGDVAKHYLEDPGVSRVILSDGFDEMLSVLEQKFIQDRRVEVLRMNISDTANIPAQLKKFFDSITCINVIEHIEDDVQALKNMRDLLNERGNLVVMVPAIPAIYGTLDSLVGHYRRYTRRTFRDTALKAGFVVKRQFYMNMPGIVSWFIAGRILKRRQFDSVPCKTLDNVVPFIQFLEKCIKPPIGQSLITVCGKLL